MYASRNSVVSQATPLKLINYRGVACETSNSEGQEGGMPDLLVFHVPSLKGLF